MDMPIPSAEHGSRDPVSQYISLRRIQVRLNSILMGRLAKPTVVDAAKRLDLWHGGELVLGGENVMDVLVDFCLYDCYPGGKNAIARYRAGVDVAPGSEEALVVDAMVQATPLSVFRVKRRERGVGVEVQDLLTDETFFVMDQGLGQTARRGLCLVAHLIRFPTFGWNMTTGATLALDETIAEGLASDIRAEIGRGAAHALGRMSAQDRSRLAIRILREALMQWA
jgi:hypothetical protein